MKVVGFSFFGGWLLLAIAIAILPRSTAVHAQSSPSMQYSFVYPETFERNDFANIQANLSGVAPNVFQSRVATRGLFALVFRNGLLQMAGQDYTLSIIPTGQLLQVTFFAGVVNAGDLVSILYYPK